MEEKIKLLKEIGYSEEFLKLISEYNYITNNFETSISEFLIPESIDATQINNINPIQHMISELTINIAD